MADVAPQRARTHTAPHPGPSDTGPRPRATAIDTDSGRHPDDDPPPESSFHMTITRTNRFARLRTLALTGIATTGAATAALTLMPSTAQAAEATQVTAHTTATASTHSTTQTGQTGKGTYGNNLDGWIKQSLDIMKSKGIPGSYDGLKRNILRESSGNPNAQNNWDVNAQNGIPSKGLLQVIDPTFRAYHVPGTSGSITDPVANITAAANYAAHRYGSIDNVNSAY